MILTTVIFGLPVWKNTLRNDWQDKAIFVVGEATAKAGNVSKQCFIFLGFITLQYIHNSVALTSQALHLKSFISSLGFETNGVDLITLAT